MPSLSERLQALGVKVNIHDSPEPPRGSPEHSIENVLPGDWWHTSEGDVYFVETRYSSDMVIGKVGIRTEAPLNIITDWAQMPQVHNLGYERFAFIDIETTGLTGGAGTYAFLIGAGKFEGNQFRLVQFFLQNPSQEKAQLCALEAFLAPCEVVVSYNGKTFDAPIIDARFITNGFPPLFQDFAHIDLLHLSRRIWKLRLPSRKLGDIERKILGSSRLEQDVPGWMIADLYFEYLSAGDSRPLRGVFYHNEVDIISLAGLLSHLAEIISHPLDDPHHPSLDLVTIGKLYEDLGRFEMATQIYISALDRGDLPQDVYWDVSKRLSFVFKRQGDMNSARDLWEEAASHGFIFACEELAKYFEHKERDFQMASKWTEKAVKIITDQPESAIESRVWQEALEHRLSRLEKKQLGRQSKNHSI